MFLDAFLVEFNNAALLPNLVSNRAGPSYTKKGVIIILYYIILYYIILIII